MTKYCEYASPLGKMLLAAGERGVQGIYFEGQKHFKGEGEWQCDPAHPILRQAVRQLEEFFSGRRVVFELPLELLGTPFQQSVWQELRSIPYGSTVSYVQQAQRIGRPKAARAVGAAIGRNPVSIVVPCHRVVGSDGDMTGYAGGLERKLALLKLEAASRA